jgi:hypothetical protein
VTPTAKAKLSVALMMVGSLAWLVGSILVWPMPDKNQLGMQRRRAH